MTELDKARANLWAHMALPTYTQNKRYVKEQKQRVTQLEEEHRLKYYTNK